MNPVQNLVRHFLVVAATCALLLADQPLKSALGLTMDQARAVDEIQRQYQRPFAAKRQQYNTQMRALRRARIANDSAAVIREEKLARQLHQEMRGIQAQEDEAIRKLLTPEQDQKFAAYLKLRREMVGSSRDDKEFTGK
ncbi:MAG: Spy/CpxP family protein refolding chaperone [Bryobacter sp.]|nr:Spy/CpxP family protein refolding chaperone [Bryobacter sp.]